MRVLVHTLLRGLDQATYVRANTQELYATEIPNEIGSVGITPNPLLRFALSSFMLLVMSLCQWLFRWAIWDRFVEDRVWQFVDLLAVTNISCFLMEEKVRVRVRVRVRVNYISCFLMEEKVSAR